MIILVPSEIQTNISLTLFYVLQLEKYKKHYELLTQKGGIQMSDMSYDYLSAWCAKEMDTVFGKG